MPHFGGKLKTSDLKRHFTVVFEGKEHGLYVSSNPSSAAKKALTKLCTDNKSKKVEFSIREITQSSKKKTYGPYVGHIEKLKEPIELKGRIIKYKPIVKLSSKIMKGGVLYSVKVIAKKEVIDDILDELKEEIPKYNDSFINQYKINLVNFLPNRNPSFIFSTINHDIYNRFLEFINLEKSNGVQLRLEESPYNKQREFNNIENYIMHYYKNL
jgi:hypothetical protein